MNIIEKIDQKVGIKNEINIMKPKHYVEPENNYGCIEYNDKKFIIDIDDFNKIVGFNKHFNFYNEDDLYPSYCINHKKRTLLEFLHGLNPNTYIYMFKNKNVYDLRKSNVSITTKEFKELVEEFNVVEFIGTGKMITMGRYAGQRKNQMCKILNDKNEIQILMECNNNILCKLCPMSYEKILKYETDNNSGNKIVWTYHSNGYILGNNNLYIHQVITGCYGNGKGTKNISVDHIDQDPLNNSYENLRIATREEQEQNSNGIKEGTKRARNKNAKELPEEITQTMLPKYVIYYKECYNKDKQLYREFFKIEKHPKLGKPWISSKSCKINIKEKLLQVVKILNDLDNNIQPQEKKTLPLYITITHSRNKHHLVYDKKDEDGTRKNVRMVLPENYDIDTELLQFNQKILEKYPES